MTDQPMFCKKDGKRLVRHEGDESDWLECPSIRKWWLPGISSDWRSHTNVWLGDHAARYDERTGDRVA